MSNYACTASMTLIAELCHSKTSNNHRMSSRLRTYRLLLLADASRFDFRLSEFGIVDAHVCGQNHEDSVRPEWLPPLCTHHRIWDVEAVDVVGRVDRPLHATPTRLPGKPTECKRGSVPGGRTARRRPGGGQGDIIWVIYMVANRTTHVLKFANGSKNI